VERGDNTGDGEKRIGDWLTVCAGAILGSMKTKLKSSKKPLVVEVTRTDRNEAVHTVHAVCCSDSGEILGSLGDPELMTYFRSAAKPFQLLTALTLRPQLLDECSDEEIAVMASSHSGEPGHIEAVGRIQERYGLWEDLLLCGKHDPYFAPANWQYGQVGKQITNIHCNCSGKHTAMMLASKAQGWPLEGYTDAGHPMQQANTSKLAWYLGREPQTIEYGVDGCNVPTWWIPIRECALAFARFSSTSWPHSEIEKKAIARIFDAYHNAPWFVGGTGRFCTAINAESDGKWIGKIGGEGIYAVAFRDRGISVVVKVIDGNSRAIPPALLHAMRLWGLIDDSQFERLSGWVNVVRLNSSDVPIGFVRLQGA
jgi:L-asparaginase II